MPYLHVRCNTCGAEGWSDRFGPGDLDNAVRCESPEGDPPGSVHGCCSIRGHTHEEHVEHVRATGDAASRPVTVTIGHPGAGPVPLRGLA